MRPVSSKTNVLEQSFAEHTVLIDGVFNPPVYEREAVQMINPQRMCTKQLLCVAAASRCFGSAINRIGGNLEEGNQRVDHICLRTCRKHGAHGGNSASRPRNAIARDRTLDG
jgi:hypothetical protein